MHHQIATISFGLLNTLTMNFILLNFHYICITIPDYINLLCQFVHILKSYSMWIPNLTNMPNVSKRQWQYILWLVYVQLYYVSVYAR